MGRPFFYVKCCSDIVGDNVAVREGARKDMSTGNFYLVKDTLTSWRIPFELCKLLFLQHCCNVSKQNFFNLVRLK